MELKYELKLDRGVSEDVCGTIKSGDMSRVDMEDGLSGRVE